MKVSVFTAQCWTYTLKVWSGMLITFLTLAECAPYLPGWLFMALFFPAAACGFAALFAVGPFTPPARRTSLQDDALFRKFAENHPSAATRL
ncbi:MAG: hypothetical protein AB1400_08660 [Pseudomonadota bacterium]